MSHNFILLNVLCINLNSEVEIGISLAPYADNSWAFVSNTKQQLLEEFE